MILRGILWLNIAMLSAVLLGWIPYPMWALPTLFAGSIVFGITNIVGGLFKARRKKADRWSEEDIAWSEEDIARMREQQRPPLEMNRLKPFPWD